MVGSRVNLTCSISLPSGVTGSPQFEWDGPLISTNLSSSEEGMIFSQLTLIDIAPSDAGPYTCTATLGGSVSTTINVIVQGNNAAPQGELCVLFTLLSSVKVPVPSISHSTLLAGATSNLTCDFSLDYFPHEASATWTVNENGNGVTQNDRVLIEGVILSFSPLNTSDSGRYSCELNITSLKPYVIVQGPPMASNKLPIAVESKP